MKKRKTAVRISAPTAPDGLTFGLDLGDGSSAYCVLGQHGKVILEHSVRTTSKEMTGTFHVCFRVVSHLRRERIHHGLAAT